MLRKKRNVKSPAKRKDLTSYKKLKLLLSILAGIILIVMVISFYSKDEVINRTTLNQTVATPTLAPLREIISYDMPKGWQKLNKNYDPTGRLEDIYSSDYADDGMRPTITSGAVILIYIHPAFISNPKRSLEEEVYDYLPNTNSPTKPTPQVTTINGLKWVYVYSCWEGCSDSYFTEINKNEILSVSLRCVPAICNTRDGMYGTNYVRDRDSLLNSIKFK